MTDNVQSAMFEILKSVQTSIGKLEEGQTALKEMVRKQRRDVAGIMVMMKSVAGDFDERVSELERRMAAVDGQQRV